MRTLILLAALCAPSAARADLLLPEVGHDEPSAEARMRHEKGLAHFQLDEWQRAIEEWEQGFRAKPTPEFLYDIAEAYREWKEPGQAIAFYRKYLNLSPRAKNRARLLKKIAALEKAAATDANDFPARDPAPRFADDTHGTAARKAYQRGMTHFTASEFQKAIQTWEDGYRESPTPELLYWIAEAQRESNRLRPDETHLVRAIRSYRHYLRFVPQAKNRPEVEQKIDELETVFRQNHGPQRSPDGS